MKMLKKKSKWYSHHFTEEKVSKLEKMYAKIVEPFFGINDTQDGLELRFTLTFENGNQTTIGIEDPKDIMALLKETKAFTVNNLKGVIIETFRESRSLRCISVNENLI
jgi:hypothetical protein